MNRVIWDTLKVFIIFVICTFLFYHALKTMHVEYEQIHRYDTPEGPAIGVFNEESSIIDRLNLFFRLGE